MQLPPAIVVLCGVSGSGKTTLGRRLAEQLGWPFCDADDHHPAANVAKMRVGQALTDADRDPWLASLALRLSAASRRNDPLILACSALKRAYRQQLRAAAPTVRFVLLDVTPDTARQRVISRTDHFAGEGLVESQFATLEPLTPQEGLTLDAHQSLESLLAQIQTDLWATAAK